jgi:hypothetical protein
MAMRLPSVDRIVNGFLQTISRFPFETFAAFTGTCAFYYVVTVDGDQKLEFTKINLTAALGLVFYLASGLFARSTEKGKKLYVPIQSLVTLLLVAYYFSLPDFIQDTHMQRYAILSAVGHLAVSFAPFLLQRNVNAFWHYNKTLFIRILTSGIYSVVLFGGLAGVLGSLDALFEISINNKTYLILGCVVFGLFNTLFFLSAIPKNPEKADEDSSYPSGLSMFTQYVLIPLVSIYMAILFAYEVKILVTFNLPKGWIAALIIAFSIVGILANLLVYPLRNNSDKGWIRFFARWFYLLMMPLLILFYWAVLYRIFEYGFTEERYYLLITAIWLSGICVYFVFSKSKSILFIPITLALLGLFTLYAGPLSASSVSLRNQLSRLAQLLNDGAIKEDGKKQEQAIEIMKYCMQTHGRKSILPLLNDSAIEKVLASDTVVSFDYVKKSDCIEILRLQGISHITPIDDEVATQKSIIDNILSSKYYLNEGEPLKITGYNYELKIDFEHITEITLTNGDVWVFDPTKHNNIIININGKKQAEIDIRNKILQLDSLLNAEAKNKSETEEGFVENDYSLNQEQLSTTIHINESYDALLIYESIVANHMMKHGTIQIPEWKAKVLIR